MKTTQFACGLGAALLLISTGAQAQNGVPAAPSKPAVPPVPLRDFRLVPPLANPSDGMAPMPTRPRSAPTLPKAPAYRFEVPKFIVPPGESVPVPYVAPQRDLAPSPAPDAAIVVDGDFLYVLRGNTLVKINKKTLAVVGTTTLPTVNLFAAPLTAPRSPKSSRLPLSVEDMLKSLRNDNGIDPGIFIRPNAPKP